jgi:hypothetical protein
VFAGPDDYRSIYVADCAPLGGPVDGTPVQIANARLIAAAPELYEALEDALKFILGDISGVSQRAAIIKAGTEALVKADGDQ